MLDYLAQLFDTTGFPARWHCGKWSDALGWLHISSDVAIFAAYTTIPVVLAFFVLRKRDIPFPRIFWLFGAFILACGLGHLVEAVIFWHPIYRFAGALKLFTALVSWGTVVALVRIVPQALQLPGLAKVNADLQHSNEELRQLAHELERATLNSHAAEAAARDQSLRTQAILDGATDSIITINSAGKIESFNRAAERMFRYRAGDVIGRNVQILMPSPYRDEHDQYIRNYLETAIAKIIGIGREVVGLRSDGSTFPMHLAVSEVKLGDQRLFTGIVRDISQLKQTVEQLTETHHALEARAHELEAARGTEFEIRGNLETAQQNSLRAEREAREQSARTQAILDGATDAIITISSAGLIESFNGAAERMFGYRASEVIGDNVKMLMPAPYHAEHDQYLVNYLQTGISKIIGIGREVVGLRADGTTFPMDLAVSEVRLGDRRLFTGIVRDITELKRALQQLSEAHDELTRRAQKIEQFNLYLSRSNEDLKQFAYVASHDLQEPLRKVTAFCQLLQSEYNERLDENAREYIRFAVDGALRMKTLVTDLLAYSRVETQGKRLEPTDADEACDRAIENLAVAIKEAGAKVTHGSLPTIVADREQLIRLFQNLVANAIKYRGHEPPIVHISAEESDDEWLIRIRDNGIGIDSQYHTRIFVIFQRLHSRDEYPGTGIGLAVCKRIVERAGGRIWVESAAEIGSVFCFTALKHHAAAAMPPFGDFQDAYDQQLALSEPS
jgi:PAS domain S-box-containing protein